MLSGRAARAALALLVLASLLAGNEAQADHQRPGGTGTPAVEEVAGAVTKYRHYNPWVCTNPQPLTRPPYTSVCVWDQTMLTSGQVHETSCERVVPEGLVIEGVAVGESIGDVVNGRCGHQASDSGNDHWSFGGENHPSHRNVVVETETRWRCTLVGWDTTLQYDSNGHAVGHSGDWCGTFTPDRPSVSIAGVTVTEGESAVLSITASAGTGSGTVQYRTQDGTAAAGLDYSAQSGVHSLEASDQKLVTIATIDDTAVESTETFTVRLSDITGTLTAATTVATVTIIDNDTEECPEGQTGTPPDCQPVEECPEGQTGTPPDCQPVIEPTGCDVADTRLASLTVTAGGVNMVSGFMPTVYSYSVTVDASSVVVAATAATSTAAVRIGRGSVSVGSASRTVLLSVGSTSSQDVIVTSGTQSCTYSLTVSRPSGPVTDCPAWSGQQLVDGVCVPACVDPSWPVFDENGEVEYCQSAGDCPWDLMGVDPSILENRRFYAFDALWLAGITESEVVAAGGTTSVTRRAAKCPDHIAITVNPTEHDCAWRRLNIGGREGDCLSFALQVEAVVPAVEADSAYDTWQYQASGCGHNRSAPRFNTWTADDASCSSTDTSWQRQPGSYCGSGCSLTAPTQDAGEWEVTLGTLAAVGQAYVDVPLEVSVTDWGDASHLQITVWVTQPTLQHSGDTIPPVWQVSWSRSVTTTVTVPRQSGPPPSDDLIAVNIADVATLPYSSNAHLWGNVWGTVNRRFVEVLRSGLLANDACPIAVDCSDPLQWPMEILGTNSDHCTLQAFAIRAMQPTGQGLVGCDNLNNDSSYAVSQSLTDHSARYWPQMWAAGEDRFKYRSYGGEATVTIRFTDQPPAALDITVYDPGTDHTVAEWDSPSERVFDYRPPGCSAAWCEVKRHVATYARVGGTDVEATHHAGAVSLGAVAGEDPDGDLDLVEITDAHNPHLDGRSAVTALDSASQWIYSHWGTHDTTEARVENGYGCHLNNACYSRQELFERFVNARLQRPYDTTTSSTVTARNNCTASGSTSHTQWFFDRPSRWRLFAPATLHTWSSTAATDPGCIPALAMTCESGSLQAWQMCYAVWPQTSNPAPLVVEYRACDDRLDAFSRDRSDAEAAGRAPDNYCSDATITVVLADRPTLTVGDASRSEGETLQFPLRLDQPALVDMTVTVSTAPDTLGASPAESGDYTAVTGLVATIDAGTTEAIVEVSTIEDDIHEADETLRLIVSEIDGIALVTNIEATGTILNDDPAPTIGFSNNPAAEEDNGTTGATLTFTVRLQGATELAADIAYTVTDGTATATTACPAAPGNPAQDYRQPSSGRLTFPAGSTSRSITVRICYDDQQEPNETLTASLSSANNATIATATATGTIEDNDAPVSACDATVVGPPTPQLSLPQTYVVGVVVPVSIVPQVTLPTGCRWEWTATAQDSALADVANGVRLTGTTGATVRGVMVTSYNAVTVTVEVVACDSADICTAPLAPVQALGVSEFNS